MLKIVAFVSGRGSNLISVHEKVSKEKINICAVVSDRLDCLAVRWAKGNNIPVYFVSKKQKEFFVDYQFLVEKFINSSVDLVILAGFLKKIPDEFVEQFENKIINIHPALLPLFGGEGMYGMNVHKAVFSSKQKISGATVHFVDKIYDHGKIIAQKKVDISDASNPEEIAEKVLKVEHQLLPWVVEKFADKKIKIIGDSIIIEE